MEKVLKIITFGVRNRHVAFPASEVREIVDSGGKLKPLFYNRGGAVKGIMEHEGEMISILDTPNLLDVRVPGGEQFILICRPKDSEHSVGITISSVFGMEMVETNGLKHSSDEEANYTLGYFKDASGEKERVVTVLNLVKFLEYANAKIKKFENKNV